MLKSVNLRCKKKVLPKTEKNTNLKGILFTQKKSRNSFGMTWVQATDLHNNLICNPDQKVLEFKLIGQGKV
jgi:hypothetical protein